MPLSKGSVEENNLAIHKHLQTQFNGFITKFIQEIDDLILSAPDKILLEYLKEQIHAACAEYCTSQADELAQCNEKFCAQCIEAINTYKEANKNDSASPQLTVNGILERLSQGIQSSIAYTQECSRQEDKTNPSSAPFLESIRIRFTLAKQQINAARDHLSSTEEEKPHLSKPK